MRPPSYLFLILVLLWSCNDPAPSASEEEQQQEPASAPAEKEANKEKVLHEIKKSALAEDDLLGRLKNGIDQVQEEFTASEKDMATLKNVVLTVTADCILSIANEANGGSNIKVNLKDLDTQNMMLIPDQNPGEFPGLRIPTIDGEPLVEHYQNGKLVNRDTELVIKLSSRPSIERITPIMVQSIYLCQGTLQ